MKILLIVPAYNEEENILKVRNIIENYNEKSEQKLDYIIINDGSTDNTEKILEDNNIFVEEDERVSPGLDDDINESNKIVITNKSVQEVQIAKISESGIETTLDEILKGYSPIVEKIEVEQEIIPYETITKDASQGATDTKNRVIQQGQDGLKEVTYKTKYQNDEQIEKIVLSEEIIKVDCYN